MPRPITIYPPNQGQAPEQININDDAYAVTKLLERIVVSLDKINMRLKKLG